MLLAAVLSADGAAAATMHLRIEWGGGSERLWHGNLALSQGTFAEPRPLGIEADEPGSMWLAPAALAAQPSDNGPPGRADVASSESPCIYIQQRSPRTYDAVELVVTADRDAKLLLELVADDDDDNPHRFTIPLAGLLDGLHSEPLDDRGNNLLVRRLPDDDLRVELRHAAAVFAPGESIEFDLWPRIPAVEQGTPLEIQIELTSAEGDRPLWSTELKASAGQPDAIRQRITLPEQEGVYNVTIRSRQASGIRWPSSVSSGLRWRKQTLAQRQIQVLVLSPEQPAAPLASEVKPGSIVDQIDPANGKWWDRFAKLPHLRRTSRLPRGPMGSGHSRPIDHPLGLAVQLGGGPSTVESAWEAYTLAVEEPGLPHVVEVDYPSDVPQTLGISLIEPNAAGALFPIGLDSGVDQPTPTLAGDKPPRWLTHRVVFWPRTRSPIVLLTNRREGSPAVYGKIRVRSLGKQLSRAFDPHGPPPGRLLAGYLDRPLFPENYNAEEAIGSLSDLGVDDWETFYQGGSRLVAYLDHVGYGGLMIAALADGSTIYPSRLLEPTPRYDTGAFLASGQDPLRKDVLEMLFRMFDRDRLQLVPAMEFAAPLPELEAVLRRGGPESEGIQWIGPQGTAWTQTCLPRRGLAPYYNMLHPRVQEAMLSAIRELVQRYAHHASFSGLAIQLSGYGYAQLPGPEWGMDDATVARFEQATGTKVPGSGPGRCAQRARWLLADENRPAWLAWRASEVSRFYHRVGQELAAARADARLYLAGASMFDGEEMRRVLQPSLPQRTTLAKAMLQVGIDASLLDDGGRDRRITLLRPEQIVPRWSLASQAVNLVLRQLDDADRYFKTVPSPGSLFFHEPQELRLASFDKQSPFTRSYTWLAAEVVPSDQENRRRFIHSLASLDAQVMFDGGWQLPMGQEAAVADLVAAYRRLPAVRFEQFVNPADGRPRDETPRPVTVRWAVHDEHTYLYITNETPLTATARLQLACPNPSTLEDLSGLRQIAQPQSGPLGTTWTVHLAAYDLVAVRFSSPAVKPLGVTVEWPDEARKTLRARTGDLLDRMASLLEPPLLDVLENPGFERPLKDDGRIPGWAASQREASAVSLESNVFHSGGKSLRIASSGPVTTLVSEPFDVPATGRLTMSVWLRTGDAANQPPLQVALVGKHNGRDLFYFAQVGRAGGQGPVQTALGPQWQRVPVLYPLPLERLSQLQLRFDLLGPGEVWIDDVQLSALEFSEKERMALYKLIWPTEMELQQGQIGNCFDLLEGYWPRFLVTNVPAVEHRVQAHPSPPPRAEELPKEPVETGLVDGWKNRLPDWMRF